jgi:diguanylate cyclase (GGDEF)-like protein
MSAGTGAARNRWQALVAATHMLLLSQDEQVVFGEIADGATSIVDCESVRVHAVDRGGRRLVTSKGAALVESDDQLERALLDLAEADGRSASSLDGFADDRVGELARRARDGGRFCHVRPLRGRGELLGLLAIHDRRPAFDEDELAVLRRFASSAAFALASARDRAELDRLAYTDSLTGLANRRQLEREFDRRADERFSLLLIDFDGLKTINDRLTYGHGDAVIAAAGRALASLVDDAVEVAARLAGDEFVLLLAEADEATALERAAEVSRAMERLDVTAEIEPFFTGASVGCVTTWPGEDPRAALARATDRLHAEKRLRKSSHGV